MVIGYNAFFSGCKEVKHEADPSPPSSIVAQHEQTYASALPVCLHGVHRDSFIITFTLL